MATIRHGDESPNQRGKQQQIVEAARVVLARDGLAGATARAIADAGPLTKSAVHYYFQDTDDVVDLAMAAHLDAVLDQLNAAVAAERRPERRFGRVVDTYLQIFTDRPHAALLWFEFWIARTRAGRPEPIRHDLDRIADLLRGVLADAGHPEPVVAADVTLSWLLGAVVQGDVRPAPAGRRRRDVERLLGLATPHRRRS